MSNVTTEQQILSTLQSMDDMNGSAHDDPVSGNPTRIGAYAASATPTQVANGDTVNLLADRTGKLIVRPWTFPDNEWAYAAASSGIVNTTSAVTIKAAASSGNRNYITSVQIMAEALGTATEVAIRDGAGGTVLWRTKIGTGGLTAGLNVNFVIPLKGSAATLLEVVTLTASSTGAVYFNAQGFIAP